MTHVPEGTKSILENYSRVKIALICFTVFSLNQVNGYSTIFHLPNLIIPIYFVLKLAVNAPKHFFCTVGKNCNSYCIDNNYLQKEKKKRNREKFKTFSNDSIFSDFYKQQLFSCLTIFSFVVNSGTCALLFEYTAIMCTVCVRCLRYTTQTITIKTGESILNGTFEILHSKLRDGSSTHVENATTYLTYDKQRVHSFNF